LFVGKMSLIFPLFSAVIGGCFPEKRVKIQRLGKKTAKIPKPRGQATAMLGPTGRRANSLLYREISLFSRNSGPRVRRASSHAALSNCFLLHSRVSIEEFQWLGPDLFLPRARTRGGW